MKKFLLTTLAALLLVLHALAPPFLHTRLSAPDIPPSRATPQTTGSAPLSASLSAGGYACILSEDAYFYASYDDKRGLFLLPKTYFVKVLETNADFCKVEYLYDDSFVQKLVGYVKTSLLTFVDYVPKRPYLYRLFELKYRLEGSEETDGFLTELTVTCAYYGDYPMGSETYCYVLRDGEFGYVPKPDGFSYEQSTEYAENVTPEENDPISNGNETTGSGSSNAAQIAILVVLCLLVPVLAALILKPPRRPPYEQE